MMPMMMIRALGWLDLSSWWLDEGPGWSGVEPWVDG